MRQIHVLLLFITFVPASIAQEYAEFSADTTRLGHHKDKNGVLLERIKEQEWFINGQRMYYGCQPIRVAVNPDKLDTVLYRASRKADLDTIICNIAEPEKYRIYHNDCCKPFYIKYKSTNRYTSAKIVFSLSEESGSKTYLGTLGEAGLVVHGQKEQELIPNCRSAMNNNIYTVSFREIEFCEELNCDNSICLQEEGEEDPDYYSFRSISTKLDFKYMPLNSNPIFVTYDPKTDSIRIDWNQK